MDAWTDAQLEAVAAVLAERADAIRAELEGLTEAPADFGTVQFGKRAGDATNVAAEQLSRVGAHEQLLAVLADIERAQAKLAEGPTGSATSAVVRSVTRASKRCRGRRSASAAGAGATGAAGVTPGTDR